MVRIDLTDDEYSLLLAMINEKIETGNSYDYRKKEFEGLMKAVENGEVRDWYSYIKFVTKG